MTLLSMCRRSLTFTSSSSSATAADADAGGDVDIPPHREKYDVFISFRGEDTRLGITSHLHEALLRKKIETYIDYWLVRGEEIGPSLRKAIEKSKISVIIFSQNYASSTWCLDELVHILRCKEAYGQLVIPVFYDISPSDVQKQQGSYAVAFAQLEKRFKNSIDKVHKWRAALTTIANLSGFDNSNKTGTEADLVKKVVDDIWNKLIRESSCDLKGLVGIERRIEQIESLLCIHSLDTCITVGIWGMGGIGKTTLSETVFHRLSSKFEASCFLRNVRENSEQTDGLYRLQNKLLKEILKEEGLSIGSTFVRESLSRTKVLIVLDDVSDSMQIEHLAGIRLQYGTGSRIIITSRDRSTLRQTVEEDKIYKVEGLKPDDALQLFCSRAFKNNSTRRTDYKELAEKAVDYVGGIPLALVLLGSSFLNCKSKEEWEDELNKLKQFPNENIQRVLRLSYDGLGRNEKEIFLDIACFHKGKHVDYVKKMLAIRGFFAGAGIRVLVDMSLISIHSTKKTIEMHDLLQEIGSTIVHEQCIEDPAKRNRLFNDVDIYRLLKSNTGTPIVQAILVNWFKIEEQTLKRANFKFGTYWKLTASLDLPNSLRYLYWRGYPLKSLPSNFSPENLVELHMPESQVKELWNEPQRLVNLEVINLQHSKYLTEVPNLSWSLKIVDINLCGCESLVEIPWCFQRLHKLTHLDLARCTSLKYLPEMPENIEILDLYRSGIQELPESVWSHEKITYMDITDCRDLKKLPSNRCKLKVSGCFDLQGCTSLGQVSELPRDISKLSLVGCKSLVSLPTNICKLKYLRELDLSNCSKLENFPEILEPMEYLEYLCLSRTAVLELHSSIEFLPALKNIQLRDCKRLSSIPRSICNLKSLERLDLTGCSAFYEFPPILEPMEHLNFLSLKGTALEKLPSSIGSLFGLETLDLDMCKNLNVVPRSIYSLTNLKTLSFRDCRGLKELPSGSVGLLSLEVLDLRRTRISEIPDGFVGSISLQDLILSETRIRSIPAGIRQASRLHRLSVIGCKRLQSLPELPVVCDLEAHGCTSLSTNPYGNPCVSIVCPGNEIPNWFSFGYQSEGSSVHIKLPPDWFRTGLSGFALSGDLRVRASFNVKLLGESHELFTSLFYIPIRRLNGYCYDRHHVYVWNKAFISEEVAKKCSPDVYKLANEASVEFYLPKFYEQHTPGAKVEKCGICPFYVEDAEKFKVDHVFVPGEPKIREETRQDENLEACGSSYVNKANESDDESLASDSSYDQLEANESDDGQRPGLF
ncbi:TMV resistance protein N-like [Pyrus ussuriensis x Pyrus communis]|uniref:ADP-ribosyl cyclase/cyclic ADP-ribose hydrolase n=1 Tax=Pyrus ussuriensis x Pyrus communis TaxID=2448454 RepID=A0A5N5FWA3_9ROSA|nr:TMV resistance protein N-like [Pyrus ussuriensis x Pyrus communis]